MRDELPCATCGRSHPKSEIELTFRLPDAIFVLSEAERSNRCHMSSDLHVLDRKRFFVRGLLPLPVHGRDAPYRIGIWAEVDEQTFADIYHLWNESAQAECSPFLGSLANDIPTVPTTLGLPIAIHLTGPKTRPEFFLPNDDHPLGHEQSHGIDSHRA